MNNLKELSDISDIALSDIIPATGVNYTLYQDFSLDRPETQELYLDIKSNGVRTPLHVSKDGILVDGHTRYQCARLAGISRVKVIYTDHVFREMSDNEQRKLLASYNIQRQKTTEELFQEKLLQVEPLYEYGRLIRDREARHCVKLESNIETGGFRKRCEITRQKEFLAAAIKVICSEREYWPTTVRRDHYLLLSNPPRIADNRGDEYVDRTKEVRKNVYQNTKADYQKLSDLLVRARLSGIIPWESVDDETRAIDMPYDHPNAAAFIKKELDGLFQFYRRDLLAGQHNHVEVMVEKFAIRKHVLRVTDAYGVPLTTTRGMCSLPPRRELQQRFLRSGKKHLVVILMTDHDPAGYAIAESFVSSMMHDFGISNLTAQRVAVKPEDAADLPGDMEAKESSATYQKFFDKYGNKAVELDAMPTAVLQDKLRNAIESALDMTLFDRERANELNDSAWIAAKRQMITDAF